MSSIASVASSQSGRPPSQHSRYGDQLEAILLDELHKHMRPAPIHWLSNRVMRDNIVLQRAKDLLASATGFIELHSRLTGAWRHAHHRHAVSVPGGLPRALRFEELEADIWAEVEAGAAQPLLAGVVSDLFTTSALRLHASISCIHQHPPHRAGVLVVEATTDGRQLMMELKMVKMERVLAYAEAEGATVVCAVLAVQKPDLGATTAADRLCSFLQENAAAMPRAQRMAESGALCLAIVPGERKVTACGSGHAAVAAATSKRMFPVAVHGADYFQQMREDMGSMADDIQRLQVMVQQGDTERTKLEQQLAAERSEQEQQRAADRDLIRQLQLQMQALEVRMSSSNADIEHIKRTIQPGRRADD